jgi:ribosomal protein S18 acetylase RimI-like enzyme
VEGLKSQNPVMIRDAILADAVGLAEIHVRSWQAVYVGLFPDDFLAGLSVERRAEGWRQFISMSSDQRVGLVVEEEGRVVGFSRLGCADDPTIGEVYAIYLDPDYWHRGLGRSLMDESETRLKGMGFQEAVLWVLERNDLARRFYQAAGWHADGGIKIEPIGGIDANEVRYRKRL